MTRYHSSIEIFASRNLGHQSSPSTLYGDRCWEFLGLTSTHVWSLQDLGDKAKDAYKDAKSAVKDAAGSVKEGAKDAKDAVKGGAKDA